MAEGLLALDAFVSRQRDGTFQSCGPYRRTARFFHAVTGCIEESIRQKSSLTAPKKDTGFNTSLAWFFQPLQAKPRPRPTNQPSCVFPPSMDLRGTRVVVLGICTQVCRVKIQYTCTIHAHVVMTRRDYHIFLSGCWMIMQRMLILTSPTPSASTALMLLYPYSRWSQLVFSPPSPFSWLGTLNASNPELSSPS